jgi:3-hydroxybutyrate dehydrogenase
MAGDSDLTPPEPTPDDFLVLDDPWLTSDDVAVVTGGASGIGRATTLGLAMNGLTVVSTDMDEDGLAETVDIAEGLGAPGRVETVDANLTNDDEVASIVEAAAEVGQLRYVANIAGLQHIDPIDQFPTEKWDLLQDVMVRAPFLLTKHAMPHIRDGGGRGAIGNMASVHGHYATSAKAAYITAKFALRGLTNAIAAEGNGDLRGFSVSVGYVLTPLMADQIQDTAEELGISEQEVVEDRFLGQARLKDLMSPAEVANLFTFGFSSHSRHLNGADMLWDGGYTGTYE